VRSGPTTAAVALLPAFLLLAMLTALGFGLWLSALNVRFRDVNYPLPDPGVDVRDARDLRQRVDPGAVLVPAGPEPDDGGSGGVPLGAAGQPAAGGAARRLDRHRTMCIDHGGDLFPPHGAHLCGHYLKARYKDEIWRAI
jgi:hypothetical protein